MSTLFKRPNSRYWQCAFTSATGKRIYKSTGQTKKGAARDVATELERRARNLDPQGQQQQRALLGVLEEATTDALRGKLTGDLARDYLERVVHLAGLSVSLNVPTVEEWLRSWLDEKKRTNREGTAVRYRNVIDSFLKFLPDDQRKEPLTSLEVEDIRKYRDQLSDEGKTPTTVNLAVKTLRIPLNQARKQGYIRVNPAENVDTLRVKGKAKTAFTPDEVAALVNKAREKSVDARTLRERDLYRDWEVAIQTAYYTGQRQSDVANLKWAQVDLEGGKIEFRQEKTDTPVVIPLHPSLADALARQRKTALGSEVVFPTLFGKTSGGNNGLSGMFRRLMLAAKIENPLLNGGEKGRQRYALSFHSLRHAFNTHMAQAGVTQEVRQLLTGHASESVNDRYTHLGLESLREAVGKLPGLQSA